MAAALEPHVSPAPRRQAAPVLTLLLRLTEAGTTSSNHVTTLEELYAAPLASVEPYLLQVVHTALTHRCDRPEHCLLALRKYLMHVASLSLISALRMCWAVDASAPLLEKLGVAKPLEGLRESIEAAAVNRSAIQSVAQSAAHSGAQSGAPSPAPELLAAPAKGRHIRVPSAVLVAEATAATVLKDERAVTFNDVRSFVRQMVDLSGTLRTVARPERKTALREHLAELNPSLAHCRVFLPTEPSTGPARWIVRLVPEESTVFSSRERTPFLLFVEVVEDADPRCTCGSPAGGPPVSTSAPHPEGHPRFGPPSPTDVADADTAKSRRESLAGADDAAATGAALVAKVYGETFAQRRERIRQESPFGKRPGWGIAAMVVKEGDDLRQEELALQLIAQCARVWDDAGITAAAFPYVAMATTFDGGVLEFITDATSIDALKKAAGVTSLHQYFVQAFGGEGSASYQAAQRRFTESMAAYSIITYLLNIKDRHNGNLMLARDGRMIHIDFGFMFATSPGGMNFESAPFKLTAELLDVMGGTGSPCFAYFKVLLFQCFVAVRARAPELLAAVELMLPHTTLPCFKNNAAQCLQMMRHRFALETHRSDADVARLVVQMVVGSADNWRTRKYDQFQTWQNGIV